MLNYETILSSYDDKMTLMQWLKRVEEALNHASATAFRVNKKGNATISFILDFEDGTTLESGDIVLQQGESVNGAYIENNHLFITLTNGQVIDAGLMFNGNLTINGTLDATKVTGNEIVEKMSGYSFHNNNTANIVYAGAVKNGNKLTLCVFGNFVYEDYQDKNLGWFFIPSSILAKLIPYTLAGDNQVLDNRTITLSFSLSGQNQCAGYMDKDVNKIITRIVVPSGLTKGATYVFRYEATFLLSDNMAGN